MIVNNAQTIYCFTSKFVVKVPHGTSIQDATKEARRILSDYAGTLQLTYEPGKTLDTFERNMLGVSIAIPEEEK